MGGVNGSLQCICRVPGAKAGRDSMDIEIFGMAGVPDDMRPGGVFGTFDFHIILHQ